MTATSAIYINPKDRKIAELVRTANRLALQDLSFLLETAKAIELQRMEHESRLMAEYNPDPDPHGV
jgi:hypothetical protein